MSNKLNVKFAWALHVLTRNGKPLKVYIGDDLGPPAEAMLELDDLQNIVDPSSKFEIDTVTSDQLYFDPPVGLTVRGTVNGKAAEFISCINEKEETVFKIVNKENFVDL
jgi:hypothetical protein